MKRHIYQCHLYVQNSTSQNTCTCVLSIFWYHFFLPDSFFFLTSSILYRVDVCLLCMCVCSSWVCIIICECDVEIENRLQYHTYFDTLSLAFSGLDFRTANNFDIKTTNFSYQKMALNTQTIWVRSRHRQSFCWI